MKAIELHDGQWKDKEIKNLHEQAVHWRGMYDCSQHDLDCLRRDFKRLEGLLYKKEERLKDEQNGTVDPF